MVISYKLSYKLFSFKVLLMIIFFSVIDLKTVFSEHCFLVCFPRSFLVAHWIFHVS